MRAKLNPRSDLRSSRDVLSLAPFSDQPNLTSAIVDQIIIDGAVNGVAKIVGWGSRQMRQIQTGFVRNYALVILTGAVFVVICLIWLLPRH